MSRAEGKKATMQSGNYQDNITWPLIHNHNNNATDPDVIDIDLDPDANTDPVLPTVERVSEAVLHPFVIQTKIHKLQKIIRAIHASPQCHQAWTCKIQFVHLKGSNPTKIPNNCSALHMLILDVRT